MNHQETYNTIKERDGREASPSSETPQEQYHDDAEANTLSQRSSRFQKVGASPTWPSIANTSIIPKYNHIFTLFAALLLSTTLAFFSALDAALHCTSGTDVWLLPWLRSHVDKYYGKDYYRRLEDVYYYDNDDYYNSRLFQADNCKTLFMSAIVPVCPIVSIVCIFCCLWTIDSREWTTTNSGENRRIPDTVSFPGDVDRDRKRFDEFQRHVKHQVQHLKDCYKVFFMASLCMGLWIYSIVLVHNESDYALVDNDYEKKNLFKLQFQSLGALNHKGEVGQNANLYYSSWISLLVSIALFYELGRITSKHYGTTRHLESELTRITRHRVTQTNAIEMIMTWSKSQQQLIRDKRSEWQEPLYKLRFRTGIWLTTFIATVLLYKSSQRVWENSIYPTAVANGEVDDDGFVCTIFNMDIFHPSKCERTKAARGTGILCTGLAVFALLAHYNMHSQIMREMKSPSKLLLRRESLSMLETRRKMIPLRVECLFACLISVVLAINALFATAVEGPAAKVGNLYYSSWIAFVSSMRLTLNCLEDILDEDEEVTSHSNDTSFDNSLPKQGSNNRKRPTLRRFFSINTNFKIQDKVSTRLVMLSPSVSHDEEMDNSSVGSFIGGMPIPRQNGFHQMFEERVVEEEEASRAKRVRRWATGSICSTIYLMAALDAAFQDSYENLDIVQIYMVICPCVVSTFSTLMFVLCLKANTYQIVDRFCIGGIISLFLLFIWVGNLILTLHNESSWAVNEIGEIKMANLYYFTWATVMNAGLLVSSYVKRFLNSKQKPLMVVLWYAVVKICFVVFGSCCDILLSIKDECSAAVHGDETATFCERTGAGAVLGFIGMAAGFLAGTFRAFYPNPTGTGQRAEVVTSAILSVLFAVSLVMITGIGGPGQSVGDLYYGSWLAFLASLGVTSTLYTEMVNIVSDEDAIFTTSTDDAMKMSSEFTLFSESGRLPNDHSIV